MNKRFVLVIVVISLFISLGLISKPAAGQTKPTPTPDAKIEKVEIDRNEIFVPCPPGMRPKAGTACDDVSSIEVKTSVLNPQNEELEYFYTVSGGRIKGKGASVSWDLSGMRAGTYTITVGIGDDSGVYPEAHTKTVRVKDCNCIFVDACPVLEVSTPKDSVKAGETFTFKANLSGGSFDDVTFNWTVSQGEIIEGQGTPSIKVKTTREMADGSLTATVQIDSQKLAPICSTTASETVPITK